MTTKVSVYPNPFTSTLRVNIDGEKGVFVLFDAAGRTLKTIVPNGNEPLQLNVDTLPAGIYFWHINGKNGKIVKQ